MRRDEAADTESVPVVQAAPESDLRVLVVEDTPVHALLIEGVLSKRGIKNIVRTTSGEDAMRLLNLAAGTQVPRPDLLSCSTSSSPAFPATRCSNRSRPPPCSGRFRWSC